MMASLLGLMPASRIAVAAIFMVAFFPIGAWGMPVDASMPQTRYLYLIVTF